MKKKMKVDTANMWTSTNSNAEDYIDIEAEEGRVCSIYIGDEPELQKQNAALIVAAVNACKQINPDNPLSAAKAIPDMLAALQNLVERDCEGE